VQASSLDKDRQQALVELIRSSSEYLETLTAVREMEDIAKEVLGPSNINGQWTLGAEVKIDYASLGLHVDEATRRSLQPDGNTVKIYYCVSGRRLDIKMSGLTPTSAGLLPALAGFVAMYHETSLWDTWHPIISGKGPVELWPRRPYHNLWHVSVTHLFTKYVELVEERMYFLRDSAVFMTGLDGKEPNDGMWQSYPPPPSFKVLPGVNKTKSVIVVQKHTTAFSMVASTVGDVALPQFVVKFIVSWLLPEIVRRILKAGAACCKDGGPHNPYTNADVDGLYAECRLLAARAAELDDRLGRKVFRPNDMPTPDIVLRGRKGNLVELEDRLSREQSAKRLLSL